MPLPFWFSWPDPVAQVPEVQSSGRARERRLDLWFQNKEEEGEAMEEENKEINNIISRDDKRS